MIAERLHTYHGYQAIRQLPGIGPVLAAVFVAEIGDVHHPTTAKISADNNASKLAAAKHRQGPRGIANCSRWSTTSCATATSARSTAPGRRENSGRNRARPPFVMTPEPSAWSPA
jgi:transposase